MAVPYTDISSFIDNVSFQCEAAVELDGFSNYVQLYKVLYPVLVTYNFGDYQINDLLRKLTGCVIATGTDLNCYPVGLETTVCFDIDGNVIAP